MHERDKRNKRHYGETPKEPPKPRKSMIMQTPVLVLNASYEPINICAARRAIVLVLKGLANRAACRKCPFSSSGMASPFRTSTMARRAAQILMGSYDAFNTSTGVCIIMLFRGLGGSLGVSP